MVRFTKKREICKQQKTSSKYFFSWRNILRKFRWNNFHSCSVISQYDKTRSLVFFENEENCDDIPHKTQNTHFEREQQNNQHPLVLICVQRCCSEVQLVLKITSFRCIWTCAAGVPPSTNVVQCSAVDQKGNSLGCSLSLRVTSMCKQHPCPHTACMEMHSVHTLCNTRCQREMSKTVVQCSQDRVLKAGSENAMRRWCATQCCWYRLIDRESIPS